MPVKDKNPYLAEVMENVSRFPGLSYLTVINSEYSPEAFGNGIVDLAGRNILVRFTRDRNDGYLEIAPSYDEVATYHFAQTVVRAITGRDRPLDATLRPPEAAEFLKEHLALIEDGFTADKVTQTVARLRFLDMQAEREIRRELGLTQD